ncbi:MAG: hypothetical protein NZ709_02465 [Candidatus Marinimicrobia bacterium]|nr:hypothetical protein [Candidatus Neomarinimicrobiota bacterium]
MRHVLNISLALILIVASPSVSRPDPVDSIPYEELVGVWTFTQNGFDHNFAEDRVLELCKSIISVNYHDHHIAIHMRLKYLDLERGVNVLTMEPCTFVDNVLSCRVESEESKEGKRTLTLYEKVRKNVYDVSALKPDGKTVSKEQTMYACPVKIIDVPKWIKNDMDSKFVVKKTVNGGMFRRFVDGKWGWYGVLFERKVKGKWGWYENGDEIKDGKYVGEFAFGKPNGSGIYDYPNGDRYEGEWRSGRRTGNGTYSYHDGRKYVGEWKNGTTHGKGTLTLSDGRRYVGIFKDGKKDGQGTYSFPNGKKAVGVFRNNRPWNIIEYNKNGNIIGKFINGKKQ